MHVIIHHHTFYDWDPVPETVDTKSAEFQKAIMQKRVKMGSSGWLMKISKKAPGDATHTVVTIPEDDIIQVQIAEICRGDKQTMTRKQMVARHLARNVMVNHAHKNWMEDVEVHDDGPDADMFDALMKVHVDAGNIEAEHVPELKAAYLEEASAAHHIEHIRAHFGIKPDAVARSQEKRAAALTLQSVTETKEGATP